LGVEEREEGNLDKDRRTFLKVSIVASAALAIGGMAALSKTVTTPGEEQASTTTETVFPRVQVKDINSGQLATVSNVVLNTPLYFNYPLDNQPNMLVKLGVSAANGVGPDGDIVAFSDLCQHLGCNPGFIAKGQSPQCQPSYQAPGPEMYCCCHGSKYDLLNSAEVIQPSPAPRAVPQVILEVDGSGNIFAKGMGPPTIWGFNTGSDDVSYDLQGGTPVS
jgi:arsenite oxidase small subunit